LRLESSRRTSAGHQPSAAGARRAAMAIEWASLGWFLLERPVSSRQSQRCPSTPGTEALDSELQYELRVQFAPIEEVFLVRHGETEWNRTGRRQGQLDAPLTESGLAEMQWVAERIGSLPIDGVFSSPLGRAISTAQAYAQTLRQTITTIDDLRELNHGDMAGMTNDEIERAFPGELTQRSRDKYQWRFPKGESYADANLRAATALRQIAESGRLRPLIVTHEMIGRMILRNLLDLEPQEALRLGLNHKKIYQVHVESKTVTEITL